MSQSEIAVIPHRLLEQAMGAHASPSGRVLRRNGWTYWPDQNAWVRPGAFHASVVHQLRQLRRRGLA